MARPDGSAQTGPPQETARRAVSSQPPWRHDLRHPLPFARRRPLSPTPHAILPPFARTDGPAGRLPRYHPPPRWAPGAPAQPAAIPHHAQGPAEPRGLPGVAGLHRRRDGP
ncbi:MAG: hypothetical protein AAGI71_18490, partial [Bacteroidota bacterium]